MGVCLTKYGLEKGNNIKAKFVNTYRKNTNGHTLLNDTWLLKGEIFFRSGKYSRGQKEYQHWARCMEFRAKEYSN